MTAPNKTIDKFHHGATVSVVINGKNRDGTSLSSPDTQVISFKVAATPNGPAIVTLTSAGTQISQTASGVAKWLVEMRAADYSGLLTEGQKYYYSASSTLSTADPITQAHGRITLQPSI